MRKFGKILTAAAAAGMLLCSSALTCFAEDYTYTVTFYAGNQGTFTGTDGLSVPENATVTGDGNQIVVSGLLADDVVSFSDLQGSVSLGDSSKYYVQGIRESGRDNDEIGNTLIRVDSDEDFVVAYGIRGNMTSYTVNYQDADGNELAPSRTYYGNVGDKPVVAYLYLEDYIPESLGLTRTLSANEAENQFTFVYNPVETQVIVEPGDTTVITTTEPGTGTAGTGTAGTGTDAAGTGETGTDETGTGTGTDGTGTAGAETDGTQTGEPGTDDGEGTEQLPDDQVPQGNQDITDLDDEEVPQGNIDLGGDEETSAGAESTSNLPLIIGAVVGIAAVAVLVVLVIVVSKRRSR